MANDPLEGKTGFDKKTGQRVVRKDGRWVPLSSGGKPPVQEASMRGRMDLGLAPMVRSHQRMTEIERRGNPYDLRTNPGNAVARLMTDTGFSIPAAGINFYPLEGMAKFVGGQDFQDYQQAAKGFESQLMPIMSGAAVSPTEADRQVKAGLPELGDSDETLRSKGVTREMMLNGAAKSRGLPLPYPNTATWGINSLETGAGGGSGTQPRVRKFNPKTGRIE